MKSSCGPFLAERPLDRRPRLAIVSLRGVHLFDVQPFAQTHTDPPFRLAAIEFATKLPCAHYAQGGPYFMGKTGEVPGLSRLRGPPLVFRNGRRCFTFGSRAWQS